MQQSSFARVCPLHIISTFSRPIYILPEYVPKVTLFTAISSTLPRWVGWRCEVEAATTAWLRLNYVICLMFFFRPCIVWSYALKCLSTTNGAIVLIARWRDVAYPCKLWFMVAISSTFPRCLCLVVSSQLLKTSSIVCGCVCSSLSFYGVFLLSLPLSASVYMRSLCMPHLPPVSVFIMFPLSAHLSF